MSSNISLIPLGDKLKLFSITFFTLSTLFSSPLANLTKIDRTLELFEEVKPEYVVHLAAKVSGMKGNMDALGTHYTENVYMNTNVLEASRLHNVTKVLSVLSTCVYPEFATLPYVEEDIHKGMPHYTNMGYGFSKRMLDVQARAYRDQYGSNFVNVIPNNLLKPISRRGFVPVLGST